MAIWIKIYGPEHPNIATSSNNLRVARRELSDNLKMLKEKSFKLATQGMRYYQAKEFEEALHFFREALKIQEEISTEPNETIATLHFNMGSTYLLIQDPQSAYPHLKFAYEIRLKLLEPNNPSIQKAQERLDQCKANLKVTQQEVYSIDNRIPIEDTSLITRLKKATQLPFRCVRDDDYKVDAVVALQNESEFEKAQLLQKDLNVGLFFQYHLGEGTYKGFVLEGINLSEGNPSRGEQIKFYLRTKQS